MAEDERDDAEAPADEPPEPSEPPEPTKPGRWVKREGRWVRASEDDARLYDEGTRHYELPSGEVVREPMSEEELGPAPGEAEDEGRFAGLFGRKKEADAPQGEPPEGEAEAEDEEEERRGRGIVVAVVVIILILLVVGLVAAAVLDIADPLGLRDVLGTGDGDGGDGTNGDMPPPPPPEPDEFRYPVTWGNDSLSESRSGTTGIGDDTSEEIPIAQLNLTQVTVVFTWTDDDDVATGVNEPDTFNVTVTAPDGTARAREAANDPDSREGRIEITFEFATQPDSPTEIVAESRANATRALLTQAPPSGEGVGLWNITISYVSGGSTCVTSDVGNSGDCEDDWDVEFTWSWYEGILGEGVLIEDDGSS